MCECMRANFPWENLILGVWNSAFLDHWKKKKKNLMHHDRNVGRYQVSVRIWRCVLLPGLQRHAGFLPSDGSQTKPSV